MSLHNLAPRTLEFLRIRTPHGLRLTHIHTYRRALFIDLSSPLLEKFGLNISSEHVICVVILSMSSPYHVDLIRLPQHALRFSGSVALHSIHHCNLLDRLDYDRGLRSIY